MNVYKGSFTVEAAYIVPLILMSIYIVIISGITLHNEVKNKAILIKEEKVVELVSYMYRKELIEDILGAWNEN